MGMEGYRLSISYEHRYALVGIGVSSSMVIRWVLEVRYVGMVSRSGYSVVCRNLEGYRVK